MFYNLLNCRTRSPKDSYNTRAARTFLQEKYTARQIAEHFGCSVKLIYKKCYSLGLKFKDKYFNGPDNELLQEISSIHSNFPNSGSKVK